MKKADKIELSTAILLLLNAWMEKHRRSEWDDLMPNPEDREMSFWLVWRVHAIPAG